MRLVGLCYQALWYYMPVSEQFESFSLNLVINAMLFNFVNVHNIKFQYMLCVKSSSCHPAFGSHRRCWEPIPKRVKAALSVPHTQMIHLAKTQHVRLTEHWSVSGNEIASGY